MRISYCHWSVLKQRTNHSQLRADGRLTLSRSPLQISHSWIALAAVERNATHRFFRDCCANFHETANVFYPSVGSSKMPQFHWQTFFNDTRSNVFASIVHAPNPNRHFYESYLFLEWSITQDNSDSVRKKLHLITNRNTWQGWEAINIWLWRKFFE